jgi:ribosome maturation protein Sdo1
MEKVLLAKIIQSEQAISEISGKELPLEYAEALLKFRQDASPFVNEFVDENNKIIKEKYAVEKDGQWEFIPELKDEYKSATTKMLEKEVELELPHFSMAVIKNSNPNFTISAVTLSHLKNFLLYE